MQREKKTKIKAALFWVLSLICMGIIFYFSSRTAENSSQQSGGLIEFLTKIFGDNEFTRLFTDFVVRKLAHCLEFTGLSLLLNAAFYYTRQKAPYFPAIITTVLYASTDEFHQKFVEGRSCELRDLCIDTFGALLGSAGFFILFRIIKLLKAKDKKRKKQ